MGICLYGYFCPEQQFARYKMPDILSCVIPSVVRFDMSGTDDGSIWIRLLSERKAAEVEKKTDLCFICI